MPSWRDATAEHAVYLTGAEGLMGGEDILEVLGEKPEGRVVEIGCGTGRLARICDQYVGYDIAPAYVELARSNGVDAHLLPVRDGEHGDWLFILHVFCHIPRPERLAYLALNIAPRLLVDIIPGSGETLGDPLIYTVPVHRFENDLKETGWRTVRTHRRVPTETRHEHVYYHCER